MKKSYRPTQNPNANMKTASTTTIPLQCSILVKTEKSTNSLYQKKGFVLFLLFGPSVKKFRPNVLWNLRQGVTVCERSVFVWCRCLVLCVWCMPLPVLIEVDLNLQIMTIHLVIK